MISTHTDNPPALAVRGVRQADISCGAADGVDQTYPIVEALLNDDLRRDIVLDRLAGVRPECLGDLLELADRVIEVVA